jgi:uncharacterized protein
MMVDVSDILKENGASLSLEIKEKLDGLDREAAGYAFEEPLFFEGKIENVKGMLKLTGKLDVSYKAKCYRCLEEVEGAMTINIEESFVKADSSKGDDLYAFDGNYVELDKPFQDNILINLPMKLLCEEACKGICPKCGCDLNSKQCDCREDVTDPRLEVLKDFFKN